MYCRYCGKQISNDAAFCQYCGKQLGKTQPAADTPKSWKRRTVIIHFRRGEAGWVVQDAYPAPVAQQNFWNELAPLISELETVMADSGWQPIGVHGPGCIELESYKSAEGKNAVAETLGAIASYGSRLLFAKNWKFTVKTVTLQWRKPSMEEGTSNEETHWWFNPEDGQLDQGISTRLQTNGIPWFRMKTEIGREKLKS